MLINLHLFLFLFLKFVFDFPNVRLRARKLRIDFSPHKKTKLSPHAGRKKRKKKATQKMQYGK